MPVEWAYVGSLRVAVRWAGWIDLGAASGGIKWVEVGAYGDAT